MQRAVLMSQDVRVINEFTQICAVTGMELRIESKFVEVDPHTIHFVDASMSEITQEYEHVHVVCVGQPTSHVWLLAGQLNAESIVTLPHDRTRVIELLTPQLESSGRVVAVTAAVGGAGTTTLAMAVAHQFKNSGHTCVLVDISDGYAGLDLMMGNDNPDVVYSGVVMNNRQFGIEGLNSRDGIPFITNNATHTPQHWQELVRYLATHFDYVVLDIQANYLKDDVLDMCDHIVVTLTNTIRDVAVSKVFLNSLPHVKAGLAIRSIPGAALAPLAIAEKLQTPLWAALPSDKRIAEQIECGFGVSMVKLASFSRCIAQLSSRFTSELSHVRSA